MYDYSTAGDAGAFFHSLYKKGIYLLILAFTSYSRQHVHQHQQLTLNSQQVNKMFANNKNFSVIFVLAMVLIVLISVTIDTVVASKRFEKGVLLGYLLAQQRAVPYGG